MKLSVYWLCWFDWKNVLLNYIKIGPVSSYEKTFLPQFPILTWIKETWCKKKNYDEEEVPVPRKNLVIIELK